MIEKIFQRLLEKAYPNRNFEAVKIGKKIFTVSHDCIGSLTYSLQGTHSYEEVKKLNALTTYSARYGYCPGKGPIAIIGIPNPNADWGYFQEVSVLGIKDFSIYLYDYNFFCKPENAPHIVKIDRTFAPGFDFYDTPDGKDLRLSNQI